MSNNTICARLSLSFKGEAYALDSVIDLDGKVAGRADISRPFAPRLRQVRLQGAGGGIESR